MPQTSQHSEDVEEILSRAPSWMVRWGLTALLAFILLFFTASYYVSYPDTITGSIVLTSETPPVTIQAKSDGRIDSIYLKNGDWVMAGQVILTIENSSITADVHQLVNIIDSILANKSDSSNSIYKLQPLIFRRLQIGEMQSSYTELSSIISDQIAYSETEDYLQKQNAFEQQIKILQRIVSKNENQNLILKQSQELALNKFKTDSVLFSTQTITKSEYNQSRSELIEKRYSVNASLNGFLQTELQLSALQKNYSDLRTAHEERESQFASGLMKKCNEIRDLVASWELKYLVKSPIDGTLHLFDIKQNQNIKAGQDAITIVPQSTGKLIARLKLAIQGSAKVKKGQKVIVSFANYPPEEYGKVYGIVKSISAIPKDSSYLVEIDLTDGLNTTAHKRLEFRPEMVGVAEIVTEKRSLLDRLFGVFRKLSN